VPSYTPVATPVVPAPERKQVDRAREGGLRPELVAPVTVITPQGDLELGSGSLLIGRLPECDVLLQDGLVSRMHARISVQHDSVVVEDLHSTNGVYVNGVRVGHSTVLREGDRVLIGTTEISMFESRDSSLMRIKQARRTSSSPAARIEPASSAVTKAPPNAATRPMIAPAASTPQRSPGLAEQVPSTTRADALKMIGGLADRLAATGNLEEATQVLSGHLRRILKGANAGLQVNADVAAAASHHALTLARWTRQPLWADYVVELHLSARLVMSAVTLAGFEDVASQLADFDRMLLGYYVDGLRGRSATLELEELKRMERLELLAKG
jgi:pSer/pThr/pTyr-binding forkhead associated (FHA) protein